MDVSYWLVFLTAAVAISISPGPDLIYIVSRTLAQGRRAGVAASLGVCSGAFVHVIAAAMGLSVILATSAYAFSAVKWLGAAYLIFLGVRALVAGSSVDMTMSKADQEDASPRFWQAYRQGVLIDILNPKVALFFMAFLPQFVRPEIAPVSQQLFFLGVLVVIVGAVVELAIVWSLSFFSQSFSRAASLRQLLERLMGGVLIALGCRLALSERP